MSQEYIKSDARSGLAFQDFRKENYRDQPTPLSSNLEYDHYYLNEKTLGVTGPAQVFNFPYKYAAGNRHYTLKPNPIIYSIIKNSTSDLGEATDDNVLAYEEINGNKQLVHQNLQTKNNQTLRKNTYFIYQNNLFNNKNKPTNITNIYRRVYPGPVSYSSSWFEYIPLTQTSTVDYPTSTLKEIDNETITTALNTLGNINNYSKNYISNSTGTETSEIPHNSVLNLDLNSVTLNTNAVSSIYSGESSLLAVGYNQNIPVDYSDYNIFHYYDNLGTTIPFSSETALQISLCGHELFHTPTAVDGIYDVVVVLNHAETICFLYDAIKDKYFITIPGSQNAIPVVFTESGIPVNTLIDTSNNLDISDAPTISVLNKLVSLPINHEYGG
jgi:hypothetical protein